MGWRERIADRLFGDVMRERVHNAVQVVDDEFWSQIAGGAGTLDESWTTHREVLELQYSLAYAGQTAAKFKAMVKAEVGAQLAALNASVAEQDVTEEYRP